MRTFLCISLSALFVLGGALSPKLLKGKSTFFQDIKKVFHYSSEDPKSPAVKKAPKKFDNFLQKALRYPKEETK